MSESKFKLIERLGLKLIRTIKDVSKPGDIFRHVEPVSVVMAEDLLKTLGADGV